MVFAFLLLLLSPLSAFASELVAIPSSTEITADENLSVEFKASVEGMGGSLGDMKYDAADFDEINSYARTQGMETRFVNGQLSVRQTQGVVVVLHPKREGKLTIKSIQVAFNGKLLRAPDLTIDVRPAGAKLGNNSGSGYPPQSQLPPGGVHQSRQAAAGTFFVRAEADKLKAYKGEQIILTYALYTRVQVTNIQVERYPNIVGFLKEDIDIPLLRGRLDYSPAVVNGHEYRRAVLAQYAIYPLKDGTLPIDTFTGKFSYQAGMRGRGGDDEDPFQMFNQFFRALQTNTESRSSDRPNIEVQPLPGSGQPANFSGLVGDFDITSVVDKYTVKVGEPVNVKVKIDGRGHAGSLERLNVAWPQEFELYEDKSNTQFVKTGQSERIFEYMLIPKAKGKFDIPPIELSMFNPDTHAYQIRKTQPMSIEVLEGSLGNVYVAKQKQPGDTSQAEDVHYWMSSTPSSDAPKLRAVARGVAMASMVFAVLSLWSLAAAPDEAARASRQKNGQALREKSRALQRLDQSPDNVFREVESILGQALESKYGVLIGSLTRAEVREALTRHTGEVHAKRVETLLELCENQRYVPGGGEKSAAKSAAEELTRILDSILG